MSGRWFTSTIVALCIAVVLVALWQRSRDTSQIRQFWGADNAKLIQQAPMVRLRVEDSVGGDEVPSLNNPQSWRDISTAPGLVHLRATLVDDRYFHWPSREATDQEQAASGPAYYLVRFSGDGGFVDVAIDTAKGTVVHLAAGRSVEVIPASRDALAAYLRLLTQ